MAEERKQERRYKYCGPEQPPKGVDAHSGPLAPQNALGVLKQCWMFGRYHAGSHFKKRLKERGFDMMDVDGLILRRGKCLRPAERDEVYGNWKYYVAGIVDDRQMEVVVALDPAEDCVSSPLAVLITVYERKPSS